MEELRKICFELKKQVEEEFPLIIADLEHKIIEKEHDLKPHKELLEKLIKVKSKSTYSSSNAELLRRLSSCDLTIKSITSDIYQLKVELASAEKDKKDKCEAHDLIAKYINDPLHAYGIDR